MEPFTSHTGQAVSLPRENIDTDQIIPASFCKRITKTGFADGLFAQWRLDGDFVLNDPRYSRACFLIAGRNFGIGSSREHAVWALRDYGFKAVIAASFGEIFGGNALTNGLLPVVLDAGSVGELARLAESQQGNELTVDLGAQQVSSADRSWEFDFDQRAKNMIMNGLDEIAVTLSRCGELPAFEAARPRWLPVVRPER